KSALRALMHFGITSKYTLKLILMDLGLIPLEKKYLGTFVDEQLALERLKEEYNVNDCFERVEDWAIKMDQKLFWGIRRSPSFENHLAGNFFPSDSFNFVMPLPSIQVLASHPLGAMEAYNKELKQQEKMIENNNQGENYFGGELMGVKTPNSFVTNLDGWDISSRISSAIKKKDNLRLYQPGGRLPPKKMNSKLFNSQEKNDSLEWIKKKLNEDKKKHDRNRTLVNSASNREVVSAAMVLAINRRPLTAGAIITRTPSKRKTLLTPEAMIKRTLSAPKPLRPKTAISLIFQEKSAPLKVKEDIPKIEHDKAWR
ncbi:hypothetical protein HK096_005944, partial [Nowakowskiella sp. JEL0078]